MKKSVILAITILAASITAQARVVSVRGDSTTGRVIPLSVEHRIANWFTITNRPTTLSGYGITGDYATEGWVGNLLDTVLAGFATTNDIYTITNEPLFKAYSNSLLTHIASDATNVHGLTGDRVAGWDLAAGWASTNYSTGTPVYVESDPVWASEKSGYATGTPVYTESDPVWSVEKVDYATLATGTLATNGKIIAIGLDANGSTSELTPGIAVGWGAYAVKSAVAIGSMSTGSQSSVAIGTSSKAETGVAIGYNANGNESGTSIGYISDAVNNGIAIGKYSIGANTNIAIGYGAVASGNKRISIGHMTSNEVDNSTALRGSLYLDGGTNIYYREVHGAGSWEPLYLNFATGTPVYAESDPIWIGAATGYLTKVIAASTYVSIPAWQTANSNNLRLVTVPASKTASGNKGDIAINETNLFIYHSTSSMWLRITGGTLEW